MTTIAGDIVTGPLPFEVYERIRDRYWVTEQSYPQVFDWHFSVTQPPPTPQQQSYGGTRHLWRHPTYAEAVERERVFREDHRAWLRNVKVGFGRRDNERRTERA